MRNPHPERTTSTTVRAGETRLGDVASRLGVRTTDLARVNPGVTTRTALRVGQPLNVPAANRPAASPRLDPARGGVVVGNQTITGRPVFGTESQYDGTPGATASRERQRIEREAQIRPQAPGAQPPAQGVPPELDQAIQRSRSQGSQQVPIQAFPPGVNPRISPRDAAVESPRDAAVAHKPMVISPRDAVSSGLPTGK